MKTIKTGGFASTRFLLPFLALCLTLACDGNQCTTTPVQDTQQVCIGGQHVPNDTPPVSRPLEIGGQSTPRCSKLPDGYLNQYLPIGVDPLQGYFFPPAKAITGERTICTGNQNQDKPKEPRDPNLPSSLILLS